MTNKIQITFEEGTTKNISTEETVYNILQSHNPPTDNDHLIAARLNNEIVSLSKRPRISGTLLPVYLNSADGNRIYRKSLTMLLYRAVKILYPERKLLAGTSIRNALYFFFDDNKGMTPEETNSIAALLHEWIEKDIPIKRIRFSYSEALKIMKEANAEDAVAIIEQTNKRSINLIEFLGEYTLAGDVLTNRSGLLSVFETLPYQSGMLLVFPLPSSPLEREPFRDVPQLFKAFKEYKDWEKIQGITSVPRLNALLRDKDEIPEFIRIGEALHDKKIARIADAIHEKKETIKTVFISGPSSSGKTTFTKKLALQLRVNGFCPILVSLDNFYKPKREIPFDEFGERDLETINALDIPFLNEKLISLFHGELTEFPIYNFSRGERETKGIPLKWSSSSILLIEGIHGLNDNLTPQIPDDWKFKIYISALTQLNIDNANRISTSDNRLLRRIVRDSRYRSYEALKTLKIWPSVTRGEERYIFPFQNRADLMFNSALDYEIPILKVFAEPQLKMVKPDQSEYSEARRLQSLLDYFFPLPTRYISPFSILREFIGGSGFRY